MKAKFHLIYGLIILLLAGAFTYSLVNWYPAAKELLASPVKTGSLAKPHYHADLKVIVNGDPYNFNQERFIEQDPNTHFHKPDFDVVHVHANGITWGDFFESLGGKITEDCLSLPDLPTSCSISSGGEGVELRFFVNGIEVDRIDDHVIGDLERVLIIYGPRQASPNPLSLVTDKACIYSEFCPKPAGWVDTTEGCTSGEQCQ